MKIIIFLTLILNIKLCFAYSISAGTYVPYFNKVQTNTKGDTKKFELNPYFSVAAQLQMSPSQYFVPELGYTYFLESSKNVTRDIIFLHYSFAYVLNNSLLLRYGLTTHWYRIMGKGGSQTLSNGSSKTKFPLPNKTVITYFSTIDLGSELFFNGKKNALRFDLNIMSISEMENTSYNYILTYNWYY
jgi:hypothetical protein